MEDAFVLWLIVMARIGGDNHSSDWQDPVRCAEKTAGKGHADLYHSTLCAHCRSDRATIPVVTRPYPHPDEQPKQPAARRGGRQKAKCQRAKGRLASGTKPDEAVRSRRDNGSIHREDPGSPADEELGTAAAEERAGTVRSGRPGQAVAITRTSEQRRDARNRLRHPR